jgi:hypothetical protein
MHNHNRSSKVKVQGLVFVAHPLYITNASFVFKFLFPVLSNFAFVVSSDYIILMEKQYQSSK